MAAQEKTLKLYPKLSTDETGLKYYFDNNGMHYTMRFAGKPIIILEYLYIQKGGKNFAEEYRKAKAGETGEYHKLLKECTVETQEFLDMLQLVNDNGLSPFVIYANTFNSFK